VLEHWRDRDRIARLESPHNQMSQFDGTNDVSPKPQLAPRFCPVYVPATIIVQLEKLARFVPYPAKASR